MRHDTRSWRENLIGVRRRSFERCWCVQEIKRFIKRVINNNSLSLRLQGLTLWSPHDTDWPSCHVAPRGRWLGEFCFDWSTWNMFMRLSSNGWSVPMDLFFFSSEDYNIISYHICFGKSLLLLFFLRIEVSHSYVIKIRLHSSSYDKIPKFWIMTLLIDNIVNWLDERNCLC